MISLSQLFEEQVGRTPQAIAVIYEKQSLTYAELNQRANQLARYLRDKGIGPDRLVGICVARSLEMVVGLLGILKAGGAYLPLDPGYPTERLAYMLSDASPRILLTQARLTQSLPQTTAEVIRLDGAWSTIAQCSTENLEANSLGLHSRHLAYVIYTSGSTGRPKGVMIEHAGLLNYLQWAMDTYPVHGGEGSPVTSSLAFDATITSLYTPLLAGRTVVLVKEGEELEGLQRLLRQLRVWSLIKISPAHLNLLGQHWKQKEQVPCAVRAFVVGGEALLPATVELWQEIAPHVRLINEYGPTETVVGCSIYEVPPHATGLTQIPIGRPISNSQIYVLDAHSQQVPSEVAGEIHIGGAGVARGYLNRPELTAELFISDPFSIEPAARLYKTGDLGRWRADGVLEYLGRNDTQVKVRGFRIELGEIEAHLTRHPQIAEAAVLAREDAPGEKQLVAYVVAKQGRSESQVATQGQGIRPTPARRQLIPELREHLRETLPEYMLPSRWVMLSQLPLTHNGKVDRQALPESESPKEVGEYVAPVTPLERILVDVWKQVLRLDYLGTQQSFFDLGGHSLHAMKLVARTAEQLGVELTIADVLQFPTVEKMAQLIETRQSTAEEPTSAGAVEYEEGVI